jgi:hypothetical protein
MYLGRKNASKGRRINVTDFSHLINKVEETTKKDMEQSDVKEE